MRTIYWVALIGSIAAAAIACSSEDDGNDPIGPGKGGSGGGVVGKGGSAGSVAKGGANQAGEAGSAQAGAAGGGEAGAAGAAGSGACDPQEKQDSTECNTCVKDALKTACATQAGACQADTTCKALLDCLGKCTTSDCQDGCYAANSTPLIWAWFGCADASCHDECYCTSCGMFMPGECTDCAEGATGKCETQCSACVKDPACMGLQVCLYECEDAACETACRGEPSLASGAAAYDAFLGQPDGCLITNCKDQCYTSTP